MQHTICSMFIQNQLAYVGTTNDQLINTTGTDRMLLYLTTTCFFFAFEIRLYSHFFNKSKEVPPDAVKRLLFSQDPPPGRCDVPRRYDVYTLCTSWAACAFNTCPHGYSSVGTANCR